MDSYLLHPLGKVTLEESDLVSRIDPKRGMLGHKQADESRFSAMSVHSVCLVGSDTATADVVFGTTEGMVGFRRCKRSITRVDAQTHHLIDELPPTDAASTTSSTPSTPLCWKSCLRRTASTYVGARASASGCGAWTSPRASRTGPGRSQWRTEFMNRVPSRADPRWAIWDRKTPRYPGQGGSAGGRDTTSTRPRERCPLLNRLGSRTVRPDGFR